MLLFLGSSSAAKSQAKVLMSALETDEVKFLPWWEAFVPDRTLLAELDNIRNSVNGAVLLFSPEIETLVRGRQVYTPNLNVLFEFGYFYGHFGKDRVATVRYGDIYLPSDFGGYIHITGSRFFKKSASTKMGKKTVSDFQRWTSSGVVSHPYVPRSDLELQLAMADGELSAYRDQMQMDREARAADAAAFRAARKRPNRF